MNFEFPTVDLVEGVIKFDDGSEEKITLTALVNIIIAFINAIIKFEF